MTSLPDPATLGRIVEDRTRRLGELVGRIDDPRRPVSGLEWTTGETAAHLVLVFAAYTQMAHGAESPIRDLEEVAAFNRLGLETFEERRPERLAELLEAASGAFHDALADRPGGEPLSWHLGLDLSPSVALALLLGEVLVHGWDLATATGTEWVLEPDDARLVITGVAEVLPHLADPPGGGLEGGVRVRVRGGPRFVVEAGPRGLRTRADAGGRVACTIVAHPVALLLAGYGRISRWRAALGGGLLVWGRRPWLALRLVEAIPRP